MESELSRLFPQASIKVIDGNKDMKQEEADIFVATAAIIKKPNVNFDLVGVLGIDNAFSRFDFRASEKAFSILMGLFILAKDKLIIQTSYLGHHCFDALANGKPDIFYAHELRERKQLKFPPYEHNIFIKVRSKSEEKAKKSANALFDFLKERNNLDKLKFVSLNAAEHLKLRGNYYWQILLKTSKLKKATSFLKNNLKDFSHSGIIITVDVDPV
jgi:primosomal protein N' (replication factor Y)